MSISRIIFAVLGVWWFSASVTHAATAAGTAIVNQAVLTYRDAVTDELVELFSNTSSVTVAPLQQFELGISQSVFGVPDATITLPHRLQNTGNVADVYELSVENALADSGDLANLLLYTDTNANGIVDPDENLLDEDVALAPGESASLVITGILPAGLGVDDRVEVVLRAQPVSKLLAAKTNTDTIRIAPTADLLLGLNSSASCDTALEAGDIVDIQVFASNRNDVLPDSVQLYVDGAQTSGVLMQMELSEYLQPLAGEFLDIVGFQAKAIVQEGEPSDDWMSYEQWTGETTLARIGLLLPADNFSEAETLSMNLALQAAASAAGWEIESFASIDIDGDGTVDVQSNTACATLLAPAAAEPGQIRFIEPVLALQQSGTAPSFSVAGEFTDATVYQIKRESDTDSAAESEYALAINGVYLELDADIDAEQLIVDADGSRFVTVSLESILTGDYTNVVLKETGTEGVYRSIRPVLLNSTLAAEGANCPGGASPLPIEPDYTDSLDVCVLQSTSDDTLRVVFENLGLGETLVDTALVDPISRVFDSTSLAGIADAKVTVYRGDEIATHPVTGEELVLITDSTGAYTLPRLPAGIDYSIGVDPPPGYVFPSTVSPEELPTQNVVQASYGIDGFDGARDGRFGVSEGEASPQIDIPVDPQNRNTLLTLEKTADRESVEPGGTVSYQLELGNNSAGVLSAVDVVDHPAYGFRFIPGSATFNGQKIADPERLVTPQPGEGASALSAALRFSIEELQAGESGSLRYHMLATAGAVDGSGINRAIVSATTRSGLVLSTPVSAARVVVRRTGVLSDSAIVFGKVYVDSTCDNIHNAGEWPIAGVRIYTQDGTFAVTDEDGQYSLYGLSPGLHVFKIDELTMPAGLRLKPIDTRQAADPSSRFVDLSAGDFHRADFATFCPQENADATFELLRKRNTELRNEWLLTEASLFHSGEAAPNTDIRQRADTDGDLSQGLIGFQRPTTGTNNTVGEEAQSPAAVEQDKSVLSVREDEPERMGDPKVLVKNITAEQGKAGTWLWPTSALSWDGRFMAVVRAGMTPTLYVNDLAVPSKQIGEQIINTRVGAQIIAWYGVPLLPGENTVEIRAKDTFGNVRVLAKGLFKKPTSGVRLLLRARQDTLEADGGRSTLPIDIVVLDANDNPANGVYFVTLESTGGDFAETDLQKQEPGLQVRVENGRGKVHLRSTALTGNVTVKAHTGALDARMNIVQIAAARPLIGAGLVEINGQWNRLESGEDQRHDLESGFTSDARIALFLKGRVKNDMHLTLSYDSEKSHSTDLLRDLNPNDHYGTYGDSSVRGVEAQSRSKLYLKLEKNKNSIMWGDYLTDNQSEFDSLAKVQRTLTGLNTVLDSGNTRVQLFAARQSDTRSSEELRGNGTAMLYRLGGAPITANSEIVELVVRDADNPGLVISTEILQRHVDYTLEPLSGLLTFANSIPSVDSDLNPVFVRISYDRSSDLDEHTVAGVRLRHKLSASTLFGISLSEDQNPINGYSLAGVDVKTKLVRGMSVSASAASIRHNNARPDGNAQRVQLEHLWQGRRNYRSAMTWARATADFDNASAGIASGREEWRLDHHQPLDNTSKMTASANHSRGLNDGLSHSSASVLMEKAYSNWSVSTGVKHHRVVDPGGSFHFNTVLIGTEKRFTAFETMRGSVGLDVERDIRRGDKYKFAVSARLQLHKNVNAYARLERDNGLSTQTSASRIKGTRTITVGVESDVLPATQLYSEYRFQDGSVRQAVETASGIRGNYEVEPGLTVSPAFEVIDVLDGDAGTDSVALSLGVNDARNANRKLSAQAEVRDTSDNRYYGFRGSVAQKLSVDWTGLLREEFTRQTPDVGELTSRHRMTLGFAHRPKRDNRHHALFMANWKQDYGPGDGMDKTTYLLSTHQNRQVGPNLTLSGRFGSRWSSTRFESGDISSNLLLGDVRTTVDFKRRWEFDIRAGVLATRGSSEMRYSVGAGIAWVADRNVRLGVSYNFLGFREEDLDEQGYNLQGLRAGLQIKFDEDWFQWLE